MKRGRLIGRRLSVIFLSMIMIVTMIPLMGSAAFAEDAKEKEADTGSYVELLSEEELRAEKEKEIKKAGLSGEISADDLVDGDADEEDPSPDDFDVEDFDRDDTAVDEPEYAAVLKEVAPEAKASEGTRAIPATRTSGKALSLNDDGPTDCYITVSDPDGSGIVTIQGYVTDPGYSFNSIYVDDNYVSFSDGDLDGRTSFEARINMKYYEVGYHKVSIYLNYGSSMSDKYFYRDEIPTYIYEKPSNSISWYQTGINYFSLYYGGSDYSYDSDCDVYMDYKVGSGSWKTNFGPISESSYSLSKKSSIKANKTVSVRLFYGKVVTYNGNTVLFTGKTAKQLSKTVKVKTAYKKPKVKSIKISRVKVKVHKWRVHYANRIRYVKSTGRIISVKPLYHTYRSYRTKFKVTVSFKKKQGVAGIYIRCKELYARKGGNKKKYAVNFTLNGKKKGKKVIIRVQSFRSSKYGGYSKELKKRVKVK